MVTTTDQCKQERILYTIISRVHKKEKRVSNCTIAAHKRCFRSTKYTCVCSILHSGMLLSKQLYKSIDTLFSFLCTLDNIDCLCTCRSSYQVAADASAWESEPA